MPDTPKKVALAVAASAVAALGAVGIADAAKHHAKRHSSAATRSGATHGSNPETELTGATATSAKDAALAALPGGTVRRASTENPSDASGAAYEVHVTKSDGSEVEVLLDSAFKVISTKASPQHGRGHDGRRGPGGPGGPGGGNPAETELTGATATSAKDAALAEVPGDTVTRASKEDPSDASGAAYEVHLTKSDGSRVEVLEDANFKVLSTQADHPHGPHA
jgi:uncharacterized membrane protein YkoI